MTFQERFQEPVCVEHGPLPTLPPLLCLLHGGPTAGAKFSICIIRCPAVVAEFGARGASSYPRVVRGRHAGMRIVLRPAVPTRRRRAVVRWRRRAVVLRPAVPPRRRSRRAERRVPGVGRGHIYGPDCVFVCVCVCVCVCVFSSLMTFVLHSIHQFIHIHTHTQPHTRTRKHLSVRKHICILLHMRTCTRHLVHRKHVKILSLSLSLSLSLYKMF